MGRTQNAVFDTRSRAQEVRSLCIAFEVLGLTVNSFTSEVLRVQGPPPTLIGVVSQ